jgi:ATP-binding cassette subfamily B protein
LGVGAAVAIFAGVMRPVMKRRHKEVRKAEDQVMATMQEDLQQLTLIKSLQAEAQILNRFQNRLVRSLKARTRRRRWSISAGMMIATISQAGSGALLLWGATQVAAGAMTYGSLSAMLQLLSLFRGPVVGLSGQLTKLSGVEVAAERLVELIGLPDRKKTSRLQQMNVEAVVFENVTFSYPGDEAPVLSDFNMQFPLNDWACLTGISGKGKTTLFKLMLGLYTPQKGRVYLKTNMGQIPCSMETRHLFAYVPQDFALFSGTIRDNLHLVAPDADEHMRKQALHIADADFVWELTNQEKTQVRENNAGLSKGQLQRLAIARAVLMERPILLLDECTSALDARTESIVLENLQSLGKKAVLVTHRPEAVAQLDKITFVEMTE